MVRATTIFAFCLYAVAAAGADDYEPRVCASAVPYVGAPQHAPVPATAFARVNESLSGALDPALVRKLDEAADWILSNTKAPALTVAVGLPGVGTWSKTKGMAVTSSPTPLATPPYFHWASVGKTFTAAIVMQLIDEGRLNYADPLARWFPRFPNAQAITIDHLLTHTNGIFSFNTDRKFQAAGGCHPPERLIEIAAKHGCVSCPGERWYYSNTGYVFLGRIIELIEGEPLHVVMRKRIIEPLGLAGTIALEPGKVPKELAVGHIDGKPDRDFEPTTPFAAGMVAATSADMVHFWQAMLGGKLVRPSTIEQAFAQLYPMFEPNMFYGRGVMLSEFPGPGNEKVVWLGHSGGTPGIKTMIAYDPAAHCFLAVAINGNVSAEATANKLRQVVMEYRRVR